MSTILYRSDCIDGRTFETEDEVKRAKAAGWVDSPNAAGPASSNGSPPLDPYKPMQSDNQRASPVPSGSLARDQSPDGGAQRRPERAAGDERHVGQHEKPKGK